MFDTDKVERMVEILEKLPENFDNIYIVPEIFTQDAAALFKRLKLPIRAIMHDTMPEKELFGIPVIKTAEASENFNEHTNLIILTKKSVPFIQTTFDFKVRGEIRSVPTFVISVGETLAVYDRLMIKKLVQMYYADGISEPQKSKLAKRFARGLSTYLNKNFQDFKYQLWDSSKFFKPGYDFDDAAIVIQGPIAYENNYTVETFKLYRSIYPNAPIIVSTWKDEATDAFRKKCKENSIILLENELLENRGYGNINLQLKSSFEGVKYVKDNTSAKFVLKTRTDQRIYYFSFLAYFKNLLETFPPKGDKLRERIIFLGSVTTKHFPFNFHDFLAFGHVEDISKLYDIPFYSEIAEAGYQIRHKKRVDKIEHLIEKICGFDYNSVTEHNHKLYKLNKMANRLYWPETYFARTFYEKYIAPIDATKLYETSWKFTVDYLILVDFGTLQLDWPKYENMRYSIDFSYGCRNNAFARWLDMYRNFKIDWV